VSGKIRWGIISTASIAEKSFIPALRETDRGELVAVSSRDRSKADAFAKKHGIPLVFEDYASLLESDKIDAVYNPLPNTMHAEWTLKAAEQGKHIFCEKPLAMSADEITAMSDGCQRAGVQLIEAFVFLFHDQTTKLRQILDSGAIGDLTATHAYMNYRIERPSDNIRLNKALGGGGLLDGGVYPLTFTRFVFKEEPIAVQASCFFDPAYGVDTRISSVLEFSGGRFASIQMSMDGGRPFTAKRVLSPRPIPTTQEREPSFRFRRRTAMSKFLSATVAILSHRRLNISTRSYSMASPWPFRRPTRWGPSRL
jgi:D-xylose 1-dehydrogenase (NADP+, D-xylono-1,5-lactone-forming)